MTDHSSTKHLNDTWLKAAALGCLWACTEIVLGGFLHNLRVPLAGNIMAAVGIILMVSVGQLWPVRGLFWRAGLICALMKSLAPATVIFGPMIAISCQACLMELSVRVFRRHAFSYILGAMLAMSWNMAQFLINTLLAYGQGAIDIYLALVNWAQKNLGLPGGQTWLPVLLILVVHLAFGLCAGCLGIHIGRRAAKEPLRMSSLTIAEVKEIRSYKSNPFAYSFFWLFLDLFFLIMILVLTGFVSWMYWLPSGLLVMAIWVRRYRDAVRPLLRLHFWLWFVLITLLSGVALGSIQQGWDGLWRGLGAGLAMNFRAALLLIGFSALGRELRSPRLGRGLSRGRFCQLPAALEAAVETLPWVMANLPRLTETFRRPISIFHQLVAQADFWLKRLTLGQTRRKGIFLFSGQVGEGKSGMLSTLIDELKGSGIRLAGILSPSVYRSGLRIGYDLIDIESGERSELSRIAEVSKQAGCPQVGNYTFSSRGIEFGQLALALEKAKAANLILVDEVGPWELCDQGWARSLYKLTLETNVPMIWVVRTDIVDQVIDHWGLDEPVIADLSQYTPETLLIVVREWLQSLVCCEA